MSEYTTIVPVRLYRDDRGELGVVQVNTDVDFDVKRVFWIDKITKPRGGTHTNDCHYLIIALRGSFTVLVGLLPTWGGGPGSGWSPAADPVTLESPDRGLLVAPGVATQIIKFSDDALCLVLADGPYHA
jgi:hypothetical protein